LDLLHRLDLSRLSHQRDLVALLRLLHRLNLLHQLRLSHRLDQWRLLRQQRPEYPAGQLRLLGQ
jgi:hypothetical protein